MTESEAIEILKNIKLFMQLEDKDNDNKFSDSIYTAIDVAINSLEKQIPKKIIFQKQSYGTPYRCAECEADQVPIEFFRENGSEPSEKYSWCWHCGEKLDWSEESEDNNETD